KSNWVSPTGPLGSSADMWGLPQPVSNPNPAKMATIHLADKHLFINRFTRFLFHIRMAGLAGLYWNRKGRKCRQGRQDHGQINQGIPEHAPGPIFPRSMHRSSECTS